MKRLKGLLMLSTIVSNPNAFELYHKVHGVMYDYNIVYLYNSTLVDIIEMINNDEIYYKKK